MASAKPELLVERKGGDDFAVSFINGNSNRRERDQEPILNLQL
jgi:ERCC4-type nuclease